MCIEQRRILTLVALLHFRAANVGWLIGSFLLVAEEECMISEGLNAFLSSF